MKIVLLSFYFKPLVGGIEVNSELLAREFCRQGHDVTVVTTIRAEQETEAFPFALVRAPSAGRLIKLLAMADVVLENNPCLHLSWPLLFLPTPHVVALRTWIRRMNGRQSWVDRLKLLWLRRAGKVIAISQAVAEYHRRPAVVIGNPYRSTLFRRPDSDVGEKTEFVFLGRLVSDKGADLALEALARLGDKSARLTIIGDGPERSNLEAQAERLGLRGRVAFTGVLTGEPLVACLQRHRVLLVPSRWPEPFGNVALEGMACGCVPIVSSGGGLPDAVGSAGLVFNSGDVSSLVEKMGLVLRDGPVVTALVENARSHLHNHSAEKVAKDYLGVMKACVP